MSLAILTNITKNRLTRNANNTSKTIFSGLILFENFCLLSGNLILGFAVQIFEYRSYTWYIKLSLVLLGFCIGGTAVERS